MLKYANKTKIIATIGPASYSRSVINKLINEGVSTFRLNFSHGTYEQHHQAITEIRLAAKQQTCRVAILADLQGPKIRTGKTRNDENIFLSKGQKTIVTSKSLECSDKIISIDYPPLAKEIEPGQHLLLNEGTIQLKVVNINRQANEIECKVLNSGKYSSHKGVNLPKVKLSTPALTAKDRRDLDYLLTQDINYIALSFVRHPRDLKPLIARVKKSRKSIKVIAKIEKPEALEHISSILDTCDGIMVARGDLGVETSYYQVPILQKNFITKANEQGKLVIVATQMLESMIQAITPTRAEASDIANAVFDNTDALMLSGETAVGKYPVKAVRTMRRIAEESEASPYFNTQIVDINLKKRYPPHAICEAAMWASRDLGNIPVLIFSFSGETAFYLAKIRNQSPIYAFTPSEDVANMLSLAWNIAPFVVPFKNTFLDLVTHAEQILQDKKFVRKGELIVVISGSAPVRGATNNLIIKKIGEY